MRVDRNRLAASLCEELGAELEVLPHLDGAHRILYPMTDGWGDLIELVVEPEPGSEGWVLHDEGYVHQEVALLTGSGDVSSATWEKVERLANEIDATWGGGFLWTRAATDRELARAVLNLAGVIRSLSTMDIALVQKPSVHFWEEVQIFFEEERIPFRRGEKIRGASQVEHDIDFMLANGAPHAAQAIASETSMRRSLNVFWDITAAAPEIVPVALVDDAKPSFSNETFKQLSYKARVFLWSSREQFVDYWRSRHR